MHVYFLLCYWAAQWSRCTCRPKAQPWGHYLGAQLEQALLSEPLSRLLLEIQYSAVQDHDLEPLWRGAF